MPAAGVTMVTIDGEPWREIDADAYSRRVLRDADRLAGFVAGKLRYWAPASRG